MTVLTCECKNCDGDGKVYRSRYGYGGNDPFPSVLRCDTCAGDGEYVRLCEAMRCDAHATELVTFETGETEPYCSAHAAEMRREAEIEAVTPDPDLAAIEALVDHCRAHEHKIPFSLLYRAAAAVDRMRAGPGAFW